MFFRGANINNSRIMIVGKTNVSVWLWRGHNDMGQERFQDKLARCVRLQDVSDVSTYRLEPTDNLNPNIDNFGYLVKPLNEFVQ